MEGSSSSRFLFYSRFILVKVIMFVLLKERSHKFVTNFF